MTPSNVALGYINSFSTHDPKKVIEWVTEDFTNNQMGVLGERFQGRDLYEERLKAFFKRFVDLNYTPYSTIEEGNKVAVPYVMTALDQDRPIKIDGVMIIIVKQNLVDIRADYWDGLSYMQQIGEYT